MTAETTATAPAPAAPRMARAGLERIRASPGRAGLALVTIALAAFLYRPVALWLVDNWVANPYYSHALLVFPIGLYVAWRRRARFLALPRGHRDAGYAVLTVAGALFVAGRAFASNYLQGWSLLPLGVGVLLLTHGATRTRTMAWPLAFSALALPIPFLETFFGPLQAIAAGGAGRLAAAFGHDVSYDAVSLDVNGMTFAVVPLCAGLSSTLSLLAIGAVAQLVFPVRPALQAGIYALVIPIALLANIGRITATVLVAVRSGPDAALGFFHGPGGLVMYLVALLALGGTIWAATAVQRRIHA